MILTDIQSGDFLKVQGVDFGTDGAAKWVSKIRTTVANTDACTIQIRADKVDGEVLGYLSVSKADDFTEMTAELDKKVTGVHDLYLIFAGVGYELLEWRFEK